MKPVNDRLGIGKSGKKLAHQRRRALRVRFSGVGHVHVIGKMRRAVPSMGRILKEWLWRFREIRGLMLVMENSALSSVEEKIYDFLYKDLSIKDFEEWVYISNELESYVSSDDYLELISLDFNSRHARYELEKIICKYADYSKFETLRMIDLLNKALINNENTGLVLITFYDLYCDGYHFLDTLGLGYGLCCQVPPNNYMADSWEELSDKDKKELIDGFYPKIIKDIKAVIELIENKEIVLTGTKNYMNRWEYVDNRIFDNITENQVEVPKKKVWWKFIVK